MTKMLRKLIPSALLLFLTILFSATLSHPARADDLPEAAYVSGFVGHPQRFALSCESRSAVDWAAYWGVSIDEAEFLRGLPSSDNPDVGFVGNVNDRWGYIPPNSYGVHADPVAKLLQEYGLQADARRGLEWDELRAEIAAGRPVIVWIIGQMWPGSPVSYTASDGHTTVVASFEHTMTLIGYDASSVQVVDSYSGWTQTYPLVSFLNSWKTLDNMAVTGFREGERQVTEPSTSGESYSVQQGEYLMELAQRFDTTWTELARLNNLAHPYTIHPGQILLLPGSPETMDPPVGPAPEPVEPMPEPTQEEEIALEYSVHLPMVYHMQPAAEPAEEEQEENAVPEIYVVQPGEYLAEIADRFGLDWQEVAEMNELEYPYMIYAGQELRLR